MIKTPRVLLRTLAKLLRRLTPANLPRLAHRAPQLRPSDAGQRLRPGPVADRLLPDAVAERLHAGLDSPEADQDVERPREADLPDAVVQAEGLPIQRATAVAVPVEIAYNQFTQFEDFPGFMRTIAKAEQIDAARVEFEFRRWGLRRRWRAQIVDQRPEERIAWRSVSGMRLAGVTTFHSIGDRLTRIDASVIVEPAGGLQRIARRLRLVDRALADELNRFKAFVEMCEEETGAWRGYIADGEVVDEDDYFGWESGEDEDRAAPAESSSQGPSADSPSSGASAGGGKPRERAASPGASGERTSAGTSASNGGSPEATGTSGTSARTQGSDNAGRSRASKHSGGSRSRA